MKTDVLVKFWIQPSYFYPFLDENNKIEMEQIWLPKIAWRRICSQKKKKKNQVVRLFQVPIARDGNMRGGARQSPVSRSVVVVRLTDKQ